MKEKTKRVIQRFWNVQHKAFIIFKTLHQKQSKLPLQLISSMLEKPRHGMVFKILRLNFPNNHFTHIAASVFPSARKILSNPKQMKFVT